MHFLNLHHYALNPKFPKMCIFSFSNCQFVFGFWTFLYPKKCPKPEIFLQIWKFFSRFLYIIWIFILKENILY